jgi:predicted nucleotidyltransferase component of viral defense system
LNKGKPANLSASVRQRLLNRSRQTNQDFGLILTKYALERLLYRLSISPHRDNFVLKGALLFDLWADKPRRPTRDLDLLGRGESSLERYRTLFVEICTQSVEDDGLNFLADTVSAERIRDDENYEGVRVLIQARLGVARISLQIDIGFGDVITPAPVDVQYPSMLNFPAPKLRAYPRETVVAEKFEAMVKLGMANSRMKDFYDLWELSRRFDFQGRTLKAAIQATFNRRQTEFPSTMPLCLTPEFYDAPQKQTQWNAFLGKSGLSGAGSLAETVQFLRTFLLPVIHSVRKDEPFEQGWTANGPWSPAH